MIRILITAAFLLFPGLAAAAEQRCAILVTFQIMAGVTKVGPLDAPEVKPGGLPLFHLAEGTKLEGPLRIEICDGRVTISKDVTP